MDAASPSSRPPDTPVRLDDRRLVPVRSASSSPAHRPAVPTPSQSKSPRSAPPPTEPLWREIAGDVMRSARAERNRTLQQVAARAGISPQYLSEVERGLKEPSSEMLASICGALGMTIGDLLWAAGSRLSTVGQVLRMSTPGIPFAPKSRPAPSSPTVLALAG